MSPIGCRCGCCCGRGDSNLKPYFAKQQLSNPHVGRGSGSTDSSCPLHVRSSLDHAENCDRKNFAPGQNPQRCRLCVQLRTIRVVRETTRSAKTCREQVQQIAHYSIASSAPSRLALFHGAGVGLRPDDWWASEHKFAGNDLNSVRWRRLRTWYSTACQAQTR